MSDDTLRSYREKRDFSHTGEPEGRASKSRAGRGKPKAARPLFVIHEHDASTHHFDFRLEIDGVLRSWAVPKGPSTDPSEKRLAVPTEDHPLAYADFEGVIPEGEYGAGATIVWDRGVYHNLREDDGDDAPSIASQLHEGHATVRLDGEKIRGGYLLQRFRTEEDDGEEQWLLIKMDDDEADARRNPVSTEPESVLSGRTLEEVAEEEGADQDASDQDGARQRAEDDEGDEG